MIGLAKVFIIYNYKVCELSICPSNKITVSLSMTYMASRNFGW